MQKLYENLRLWTILSHFSILIYSIFFVRSLWMKNALYSEVNFFLAIMVSMCCYGVGWLQMRNASESSDEPYSFIRYVPWREQVRIIRAITFIRLSQLTYLNVFLLTLIMLLATDEFHYLGLLAPFGYFAAQRIGTTYLAKKREEIFKETYKPRPQCPEECVYIRKDKK